MENEALNHRMKENVPKQIKELAQENGFNDVSWAGRTKDGEYYSIGYIDKNGMPMPIGLPHYIHVANGSCRIVCDTDFRITDAL